MQGVTQLFYSVQTAPLGRVMVSFGLNLQLQSLMIKR